MKILLLGKNGQVGWELQRALQPLGQVFAFDRQIDAATGLCGDVADFVAITTTIQKIQPDVVVNAAAYTAVDKAEDGKEQADLINHLAVKHLAEQCKIHDCLLIHYSTDYVFDGSGTQAWVECDKTAPINMYGQTKRAGEIALEQSQVKFINFRTSWVYATHGHNFIKTMLKLAQNKDELNIIDDQIGAPTSAELIADISAHAISQTLADQHKVGIYHLVASGETSWFNYANFIFEQARLLGCELAINKLNAIPTSAYPTPAQRPHNSRLNNQKLQQIFQLNLPAWEQGAKRALTEILNK